MCKYCKLKEYSEGEFTNDNVVIMSMKDGSQIIDLSMNRYIFDETNTRDADLIIDLGVNLGGDTVYSVKTKGIKIKYCPWCGEKLV